MRTDPEIALLLCCARARLDAEAAERVRSRAAAVSDWPRLLRLATRHGLLPLLQLHVDTAAPALVPAPVHEELAAHARLHAAHNLRMTSQLFEVLGALAGGGVEAVPYKGPALAAALYGNLTLRQFTDLDVLVRPRDVPRATSLLLEAGWRPYYRLAGARQAAHIRLSYVQLFQREDGEANVELHWRVAPRFFSVPFDVAAIWPRLREVTLAGRRVRAPAANDLLLMLAVHGAKDLWERLEWVAAVAEVMRDPTLDWQRAIEEARAIGGERIALLAVALARELLGAEPPPDVARRIDASRPLRRLTEEASRRLIGETAKHSLIGRTLFHLHAHERLVDRARYCSRILFTSTPEDWAAAPLPEALAFLHLPVRVLRLTHKYLLGKGPSEGPFDPPRESPPGEARRRSRELLGAGAHGADATDVAEQSGRDGGERTSEG